MGNLVYGFESTHKQQQYFATRKLFIDPIDLLEFFPTLIKNELYIGHTIQDLSVCIYFNEYFNNMGYVRGGIDSIKDLSEKTCHKVIIDNENDIRRVNEERFYSAQLAQIFVHIRDKNVTMPKNIYDFISLATKLNITDGIINKIIYHEAVDMLLCVINSKDLSLIKGCLRNPRNNNISVYHKCVELGDQEIINLVRYKIITKNLLVKEVFGLFSMDVYNYLSIQGMLYL